MIKPYILKLEIGKASIKFQLPIRWTLCPNSLSGYIGGLTHRKAYQYDFAGGHGILTFKPEGA